MRIEVEYELKKFSLELKERVVVIKGDSGSGKTLLVKAIKALERTKVGGDLYRVIDNPLEFNKDEFEYLIKNYNGKIIVIDNADTSLNKELIEVINSDDKNRYIIIGRALWDLKVTPNGVSEMVYNKENGEFNLYYALYREGWSE